MSFTLRPPTPADVPAIASLIFDAFASIHDRHRFPRDFPAVEPAVGLAEAWVNHPKVFGVLAVREGGGDIVGCNFLDERNGGGKIAGVGPVCVAPSEQGTGVGRLVMRAILDRAEKIGATSVRLLQDAFNTTSMSLYASLGFDVKEPCVVMAGKPEPRDAEGARSPERNGIARPMREVDLDACADLCRHVHGFDRAGELRDALRMFRPFVLERNGRITAYASAPAFWILNHGVAEAQADLLDLLALTGRQLDQPLSLLIPTRNAELFRWCLSHRLRVIKPMTLMVRGEYPEPRGAWFPSVEY